MLLRGHGFRPIVLVVNNNALFHPSRPPARPQRDSCSSSPWCLIPLARSLLVELMTVGGRLYSSYGRQDVVVARSGTRAPPQGTDGARDVARLSAAALVPERKMQAANCLLLRIAT